MLETKAALRRHFCQLWSQQSAAELTHLSQLVCIKLRTVLDWSQIGNILTYQPIAKLNELPVEEFLSWLGQNHPLIVIDYQPQTATVASRKKYDCILVPCLAADHQRHRLGRGGGFYDRFLVSQPRARKIGLCPQLAIVDILPVETHDMPLDIIVTEKRSF